MKRLVLLMTLLIVGLIVYAQNPDSSHRSIKVRLDSRQNKLKPVSKSIIILNDKQLLDQQILGLINKNDIEDISVLNGKDSEAKYGEVGKYGSLIVQVKKRVKFITLEQLLEKFNIKLKDRLLDIYINGNKILFRDSFFVGKAWVKDIEIKNGPIVEGIQTQYLNLIAKQKPFND